jgi:hypothetical protein
MMNRERLQTEIAIQEDAIAGVQARWKSGELSRARRDEPELIEEPLVSLPVGWSAIRK